MESANRPSIKIDSVVRTERRQAQRDNPTRRWWLVLPVVLVSMTTASTDPILLNNLIISRYQVVYGLINASSPASESACKAAAQTPNDSDLVDLSIKVQQSVSHLNIVMAGVGALPAVLSYVILGANCDRIGRRPLLIIPCVGRIIRFTILLLLVRFDLGDAWLIVANAIDGLFGSNSLLILGAIAYISDCTTSTQRARAMLLEEVSAALTRIFPLLGLGFWLQEHGYTLPIAINLGINVAALIYVCLVQPESCGANSRNPLQWLARLKEIRFSPIRAAYRVFLVRRRGHDQRTIILLTLIQILLFIVLFGFVSIHPLYLYGKPLCFNVLDLAILTSAQFTLMILISLALSFLQKYPAVNSMFVPLIGIATYAVHLILFGVAQKVWLVYVAVFIGCLFFVVMAILRAQLTKLVDETEFALVFIATGIVETVGAYVVGIVANEIYAETVQIYSGLVFFVLAAICVIPLGVTGYLLCASCSWPVNDQKAEEEIVVTRF